MKDKPNIQVIIIDDDMGSVDALKTLIETYCPNFTVMAVAHNIEDGAKAILRNPPDVVFLDVEMPGGTGFDLLKILKSRDFEVVFITAHNKYAINAIKQSALDYLLKPFDTNDFLEAVERIYNRYSSEKVNYDVLLENLNQHSQKKLVISNSRGYEYLPVDDIVRLESERSYARIFLATGRIIMVSKCLNEYQSMLCPETFFRIHNSHLINLNHVMMYIKSDGGYVRMSDKSDIPIARSKREIFIQTMQQFIS